MDSFSWQLVASQYGILFARTFVALVLLTASATKFANLREFVGVVRNFRILPDSSVPLVARLTPVVEIIVAAGLLLGGLAVPLAFAAMSLFLLFGVAVAINLFRGRRDISCGCFGARQDQRLTWSHVTVNGILAGLASLVWIVPPILRREGEIPTSDAIAVTILAVAALGFWRLWGVITTFWRLPES